MVKEKYSFFSRKNLEICLSDDANKDSLIFDFLILGVIFLSCILFIVETSSIPSAWKETLMYVDFVLNVIFSVEFFMRIIFSTNLKKHFKSIYTYIDLFAIAPFLLGIGTSFVVFRAFRFFRVFRFFRFFRYSAKYMNLKDYSSNSIERIFVIKILFTIFLFMYVASALFYQFEYGINPNITNFGDAIYFMIISATTVGYGDIYPYTYLGKIVTMVSVLAALIIVPWHIGSLVKYLSLNSLKNFNKIMNLEEDISEELKEDLKTRVCPHCHKKF